jgi:hypothetical protein
MMRWFLVLLATLTTLVAETTPLSPDLKKIVELAQAAPPEFAAQALLRVADSQRAGTREKQIELIEQAFRQASAARWPVKLHGLAGTLVDTRTGSLDRASALELDKLSLQSAAVSAMVARDPAKAREMLSQIALPEFPALNCDDSLVPDPTVFYTAVAQVANASFSPEERRKGEHVSLLLSYLSKATSPMQLPGLAIAMKEITATAPEREILLTKFNGVLENIAGDERSFWASTPTLRRLIAPEMEASFAKYAAKHPPKDACDGGIPMAEVLVGSEAPKVAGGTTVVHYWESDAAKRVLEGAKVLRQRDNGAMRPDAERLTPEWQALLADFRKQLDAWSASSEKSEADYFHQKSIVFQALVELVPAGPQRDKTLQEFIDFVSNSNLQQTSPAEWFAEVKTMLERVRTTNGGEPGKVLDAFERSANPMLGLYAAEERTFGSKAPAWATDRAG